MLSAISIPPWRRLAAAAHIPRPKRIEDRFRGGADDYFPGLPPAVLVMLDTNAAGSQERRIAAQPRADLGSVGRKPLGALLRLAADLAQLGEQFLGRAIEAGQVIA